MTAFSPPDSERLAGLADRCEAASGADTNYMRALGREILLVCGKGYVSPLYAWMNPAISLDAAVSLVPEGFMWRLQSWPDGVNSAVLEKNAGDFGAIDARHTETSAATPALALCAAALRALAHQETRP